MFLSAARRSFILRHRLHSVAISAARTNARTRARFAPAPLQVHAPHEGRVAQDLHDFGGKLAELHTRSHARHLLLLFARLQLLLRLLIGARLWQAR